MEHLRAELETATAALRELMASWPYAFAMAGGCHGGAEHPALRAVSDAVLRLVAAYGGSISAEHGVGRAKRSWLHLSRSTEEIAMMRSIKAALDPLGLLNPGVLFDREQRGAGRS